MPIRDHVPDPPCMECALQFVCETHEMACTDFNSYVQQRRTGRENRIPSKAVYRRLYRDAKDDDDLQGELF